MLPTRDAHRKGRRWALLMLTATLGLATILAFALTSRRAVANRRIDRAEAQALADRVRAATGFVVPVDDWVLAKMNDLTNRRRIWAQGAVRRMNLHRAVVEARLQAAGLPKTLAAIPFAESGYDNSASPTSRPIEVRGAGIWQLSPGTARRLGLEVSAARDERLDPGRATDAAAAYLKQLQTDLGDWGLAIAAYNSGEKAMTDAIAATGTRDLATLARAGKLGGDARSGYAQTVFAAMLLLHDPETLN